MSGEWKSRFSGLIVSLGDGRLLPFIAVAIALACAAVLFRFNPEEVSFFPRCPVFMLTGLKCPGCGTARALHCVLHGEVSQAIAFNPILVLAFPLLGLLLLFPSLARSTTLCWSVFATMILYMVIRNAV